MLREVDGEAVVELLAKDASDIALKEAAIGNLLRHRREHVERVKVLSQNMDGGGSKSMPGTFPAANATSNISTEPERQVLRKQLPVPAVSQPSPHSGVVVSRQHVPDAVARSETLKSRFLRPFSKRH